MCALCSMGMGSAVALFFFYQASNLSAKTTLVPTRDFDAVAATSTLLPMPTATSTAILPTPTATSAPPIPTSIPTVKSTPTPRPVLRPGGLPRHVLTEYWQNFADGAIPLRLSDVDTNYTLIAIAFADADPNTLSRMRLAHTYAHFCRNIEVWR
jgi:hypothetical protein